MGLALALALPFSGCGRDEVTGRYPEGGEKEILTYTWFGPKDSLHLLRRRTFTFDGHPESDIRYRGGKREGEASFYWTNGQLMEKGEYRNDRREGPWIFHHNQYVRSAEGAYREGERDGPWESYYEDGSLRARGELAMGDTVGTWIFFGLRGDTILVSDCNPSQPRGEYRSRHENGVEFETYACRAGFPVGPYTRFSERGVLEESGTYDSLGRKDSVWETFHPGGKPASRQEYASGLWSGTIEAWDDSGRVTEKGRFTEGTGTRERFRPDGRLAARDSFFRGKRAGVAEVYAGRGTVLRRTWYREGEPDSLRQWHANGTLSLQGGYRDGKRDGVWKEWYANGKAKEISPYDTGTFHGERRFFDSTGRLFRTQQYYRGLPTVGTLPGFNADRKAKPLPRLPGRADSPADSGGKGYGRAGGAGAMASP